MLTSLNPFWKHSGIAENKRNNKINFLSIRFVLLYPENNNPENKTKPIRSY